jgi:AcrR family transcriptional regulator
MSREDAVVTSTNTPTASPRRGRPATITPEEILESVIPRLEEPWTVAEVATDLGVSVSAIYYHFRNKRDILVAIGERTTADLRLPAFAGDWRRWLIQVAQADYEHVLRYPFLLDQGVARQLAAPAYWKRTEEALVVLEKAGFDPAEALTVLDVLTAVVLATAGVHRERAGSAEVPEGLPHMATALHSLADTTAAQRLEAAMRVVIDGAAALCSPRGT